LGVSSSSPPPERSEALDPSTHRDDVTDGSPDSAFRKLGRVQSLDIGLTQSPADVDRPGRRRLGGISGGASGCDRGARPRRRCQAAVHRPCFNEASTNSRCRSAKSGTPDASDPMRCSTRSAGFPARAQRLLRDPRAYAEGHAGRDALDGMVSWLPRAHNRRRANDACLGPQESALLADRAGRPHQRSAASGAQSLPRWIRGGKLTTSKWVTIAKCSSDTALRDIVDLVERGVLVRNPGAGRNTSYSLAEVR
jgi:hypothetical protein